MGKSDGFLTPKAISNRIKAKGLQKLRWYCEMCNKQCRDEAGFRNHILSESHNRQMGLFVETPGKYVDSFSREFQSEFVKLLRRSFGTKRVHANVVYQQYISDKQHTHMNATRWTSLSGFVQHLGRQGICEVEETEKGWFITYIDRDPIAVAKQEAIEREEKSRLDESERQRLELQKQIQRAQEKEKIEEKVIVEFKRENEDDRVSFSLSKRDASAGPAPRLGVNPLDHLALSAAAVAAGGTASSSGATASAASSPRAASPTPSVMSMASTVSSVASSVAGDKRKRSTLDEIMAQEEAKKEKLRRADNWLVPGIVVKIVSKQLADGQYYKQKGVVQNVLDTYIGEIEMVNSGDVIRLDQKFCETVVPQVNGRVRIVNGAYRGSEAVLTSVDFDRFQATLRITHGPYNDRVVELPYEDFSKLA